MPVIEPARQDDLEQLLAIAALRREEYARYQPQFWRPAPDAVARQRDYFASMIHDDATLVAVARQDSDVLGFAVARLVPAPPVYDPGGLTCVIDDFAVAAAADWSSVGPLLLEVVRVWGSEQGASQLVVVVAHLDEPKRALLRAAGLDLASEWWVAPLGA